MDLRPITGLLFLGDSMNAQNLYQEFINTVSDFLLKLDAKPENIEEIKTDARRFVGYHIPKMHKLSKDEKDNLPDGMRAIAQALNTRLNKYLYHRPRKK
jgi:hypothetical protein